MIKNLIGLIIGVVFSLISTAQDPNVYRVYQTELYIWNRITGEWKMETQNKDVNIQMVSYKNVINIQAKTPTLYRINESKSETIGDGREYTGTRWRGWECVNWVEATIDLVRLVNSEYPTFLFSVVYTDEVVGKVNLRYYTIKE